MEGRFDFIHAGSFLHLFTLEQQREACRRIARLLKLEKGATIFGRQMGNVKAGELRNTVKGSGTMYHHDPDSFTRMWRGVGEEIGVQWEVRAELDKGEGMDESHFTGAGCRRLKFEVVRL